MPLTREQMELLHDLHDGRCAGPQLAAAQQLARTPQGAAALAELQRLSALVRDHGAARAPVGMKARVLATLDEDYDDISRPTARRLNWRPALLAAAACLAVAAGLWFASAPATPTAPAPGTVARLAPTPSPAQDTSDTPVSDVTRDDNDDAGRTKGPEGGQTGQGGDQEKQVQDDRQGSAFGNGGGPGRGNKAQARTRVLNLDRGLNESHQVSLELNRSRNPGPLQVYSDMLAVACLHAEARLVDGHAAEPAAANDFAAINGMEVELPQDAVPALLSALRELADGQQYGPVRVPQDLGLPVDDTRRLVQDLAQARQELRDEAESQPGPRMQDFLPPAVQSERLRGRNLDAGPGLKATSPAPPAGSAWEAERKVKLVIRLQ